MFGLDPLTLFMFGAGALAFREMNRKDYGVLTPSRDERYRNVMEHCYSPDLLRQEAKLFADHGLKAQAAMLRRRADWRARPEEVRKEHDAIFTKAIGSTNIAAILQVADAFEGWTATKKASTLRERARVLQKDMLKDVARKAEEAAKKQQEKPPIEAKPHANGATNGAGIPQNTAGSDDSKPEVAVDDT